MFASVLAKQTARRTDLRTIPHEELIALALVEGGKREQAKRSRDGRHDCITATPGWKSGIGGPPGTGVGNGGVPGAASGGGVRCRCYEGRP